MPPPPEPLPANVCRPTYAIARHDVDPPPGDLVGAVVPDAPDDALDDLVVASLCAWARSSARRLGCRCRWWLQVRATRTGRYEVVIECWGHSRGCPAGPDDDGRARYAVVRL
jgi:hypothetical protein